jgi:NAD(P)H-dependent FMN reductase
VLVSPEWGGMVTPAMKNFLLLCAGGQVAHKPALLMGVSASLGGTYPIAELRMASGKNTRLCFIPEHVIVRRVGEVLNGDEAASDEDAHLRARLDYALGLLAEYARALRAVRASAASTTERFRYGM